MLHSRRSPTVGPNAKLMSALVYVSGLSAVDYLRKPSGPIRQIDSCKWVSEIVHRDRRLDIATHLELGMLQ